MKQEALASSLEAMSPLILELDDWSGLVPRVFVVADGVIWVFTDPETRPYTIRYTKATAAGNGVTLESPDYIQAAIHPPHGEIDRGLIKALAEAGKQWDAESVQSLYDGDEETAA